MYSPVRMTIIIKIIICYALKQLVTAPLVKCMRREGLDEETGMSHRQSRGIQRNNHLLFLPTARGNQKKEMVGISLEL